MARNMSRKVNVENRKRDDLMGFLVYHNEPFFALRKIVGSFDEIGTRIEITTELIKKRIYNTMAIPAIVTIVAQSECV